ncbi:ATP-dependent endonuclease [Streptomyces sp. WAC07149]|uniref:TOPRIM nucleotidyl transferase/hydrolase domain-containing protein n=1 Tax=Streptomyces sp. WAC07149 TaxID=2487425 RepID=UPI000F77ACCE|nr:TOPRIM nucleotidyl transferase/hydrolase domain-containing protein [Streptomyces sp. WAC07149]RSS99069.1 ATP-dependent endonuclease [Streptomyces sp. WAC07149]
MADMGLFRNAVADWAAGGADGPAGQPAAELAAELGVASVVLVEGPSDLAAVETLAARLDRDLPAEGVCVVSMGGAMNVGRYARILGPAGLGLRLTGLCDEREQPYFDRGFQRAGAPRPEVFVCVRDLEEEFIRALGVPRVEGVVEAEGDLVPWQTFVRQPAQRGRDPHHRMRRFLGTKKGRKIRYGHLLAQALDPALLPAPLDGLFTALDPARAGR